ncbi:hypothetical protein OUZ56_020695 [Daphnia magna]|uniref:Uncharacterized protein n=1 Tax=Daphnia magna TaxID=35525 RepID=A0ABQ9ZF64_9CRUS|nr:hypothetical protein OUZ56_020695 [Daphnia magna]
MSDHRNKFNDETFWLELLETTQETKFALLPITNSRSSPQVEIRYCRLETKHYSTQSLSSSSVLQRFICSIQQEFNFRGTTALLHAINEVEPLLDSKAILHNTIFPSVLCISFRMLAE